MKKFCILIFFLFLFIPNLYPFGRNRIQYNAVSWKNIHTVHFSITYPGGMEQEAFRAAVLAEECYQYVANSLMHRINRPVPVILYPSRISFRNNTLFPFSIGEKTAAFTIALDRRIVIPLFGSDARFREVFTHELVHSFQFDMLFSDNSGRAMPMFLFFKVPSWILEGMAEYIAEGFDSSADLHMRDLIINEEYAEMDDLTALRVKRRYMIYKEGQAFFYFIERHYGRKAMGELLRDIRDLRRFKRAVTSVTGKTVPEINREWIRFYKRRYLPLVAKKKYSDEEGEKITSRNESGWRINSCPAVSPDGKRVAYFREGHTYTDLVIQSLEKGAKPGMLFSGRSKFRFESFTTGNNSITWSGDGKIIAFKALVNGRDTVYLADPDRGKILEAIRLPLREIRYPSLSRDGKLVAFVGVTSNTSDLYLYHRRDKRIARLTDDEFTYRDPVFARENGSVIVSTNRNEKGDKESRDFSIVRVDAKTGRITTLVSSPGKNIQPDISGDGSKLLYASNSTGIFNAWVLDLETGERKRVTDLITPLFHPRWIPGNNGFVFAAFQKQGFDLYKKKNIEQNYPESEPPESWNHPRYEPYCTTLENIVYTGYAPCFTPDFVMAGLSGSLFNGATGSLQLSFSDFTGSHRIMITSNYTLYEGKHDCNADLTYQYLGKRTDFFIGGYSLSSGLWKLSVDSYNDVFHDSDLTGSDLRHYGGHLSARYPFNPFLRAELRLDGGVYEKDYPLDSLKPDFTRGLYAASLSMVYDTVKMRKLDPQAGARARVSYKQSVNLIGTDLSFSRFFADARFYGNIRKRYVFAFRGMGGAVTGRDAEHMKFYLGGYNTLRGYRFNRFGGKYMFLLSWEFRFTFIENLRFGFPLYVGLGSIGGVLFVDAGSAWDGRFRLADIRTGALHDLKLDIGCGIRFVIDPVFVLKLDFAWPFNKKRFGSGKMHLGIGYVF